MGQVVPLTINAEPAVAADGAGITAFRGMKSLQPAPLLNFIVRRQELFALTGVTHVQAKNKSTRQQQSTTPH
jgi:hypothetical protein